MKRIFGNFWIQIFLGLIAGIVGIIVSYYLAIIFSLKFSGWNFIDVGSSGDQSPITLAIAMVFTILTFTFPTLIWFFLKKFGSLKLVSDRTRVITFILFAALPLWTFLGVATFSKLQIAYANYRSVRDGCIIQNGINRIASVKDTKEIECRDGVYNGLTRTYNSQGIMIYEASYLNGKLNGTETVYYDDGKVQTTATYRDGKKEGTEVYYNEDGSTSLYVIDPQGLSNQVYYQVPEKSLEFFDNLSPASQKFDCDHQGEYPKEYIYTCSNGVLNGEYIENDSKGNVMWRVNFKNGVLDGIYEWYEDGKLYDHLEFKNGKLDGRAEQYFTGDYNTQLEYEGQYTNGLQNGVFTMYGYKGNIVSEVVFVDGQLVRITIK